MIEGFVLDRDGNPVPDATVTLWQEGEIWHKYAVQYGRGGTNPQLTFIYDNNPHTAEGEGVYYFGLLDAGNYTVKAQKDGYNGSTDVSISKDTTFGRAYRVNVTLNDYRVRALSEKELAYTGGITGIIQDGYSEKDGRVLPHACVSLWQDGRPADTPKNPQMSGNAMIAPATGNYLFEHLASGQYQVTVEVADIAGIKHNITKEATVRSDLVNVSFSFGYLLPPMPSTLRPTATPVNGTDVAASTAPGLTPSSMPAPFPDALSVMVLICATVLLLRGKRK